MRCGWDIRSALLAAAAAPAAAVLYGDEQFGDVPGGKFWTFHSGGVSIVNPATCKLEQTFTKDDEGTFLPTSWYDGVYMERDMGDDKKKGLLLINSAVTIEDGHQGSGTGEVYVFSADPADRNNPFLSKVRVGPRPVHSYAVYTRDQYWAHSDGDGHFYVIKLQDLTDHTGDPVLAKVDEANHGKLLWDEDSSLTRHGFATSTGEQHLFIIDLDTEQQLGSYDFSQDVTPGTCSGTHAIAYSGKNNHVYVECTGGGGILEYDVQDPLNPVFVFQHETATGALYETPDQSFVVAANKGGNFLHVFEPQGSGQTSSRKYDIVVPGHPSSPTFYPVGDSFTACMPLTENTNQNHINSAGEVVCDFYGCSGAATPEDVGNGICLYDASGRSLLAAGLSAIADVQAQNAPYGQACTRCENENNYEEDIGGDGDRLCTCTPACGTCAEENYDASESGVVCVDLNKIVSGMMPDVNLIKNAGAVFQGQPYSYSAECGFGRTYRTHKRGDKYDASIAHVPTNSLQIVDMSTQTLHCAVDLPGKPDRVIYVPPQANETSASDDGLSSGAVAGIVLGTLVGVVAVAALVFMGKGNRATATKDTNMVTDNEKESDTLDYGKDNSDVVA